MTKINGNMNTLILLVMFQKLHNFLIFIVFSRAQKLSDYYSIEYYSYKIYNKKQILISQNK